MLTRERAKWDRRMQADLRPSRESVRATVFPCMHEALPRRARVWMDGWETHTETQTQTQTDRQIHRQTGT